MWYGTVGTVPYRTVPNVPYVPYRMYRTGRVIMYVRIRTNIVQSGLKEFNNVYTRAVYPWFNNQVPYGFNPILRLLFPRTNLK